MHILSDSKRIFGLDLVRCIAILCVLMAHSITVFLIPFVHNNFTARLERIFNYPFGFLGVEIFFVLSGYLIGSIIIKKIINGGSVKELFNFYKRRWLRTLPLYFLVVFLLLFNPLANFYFSWLNLVFLQNFDAIALQFNPVSWSLSIEEWFYIVIPFLFLCFVKKNEARTFFIFCLSVVLFSIISRIFYVITFNPDFDFGVRRFIFLRMDSLMIGVLFSGIKYYYGYLYDFLIKKRRIILLLSLIGLFLTSFYLALHDQITLNHSFFARVFLFPTVSLFCGLLIISLETAKPPRVMAKAI